MTLAFDPNADFGAVTDRTESITLQPAAGGAVQVDAALRRRPVVGEARSFGRRVTEPGAIQTDVVWHLPAGALANAPVPGDKITSSDGMVWTILQAELQTLGSRWRCVARHLAIAETLDTLVDVDVALARKDRHGGPELLWRRWKANVRASIQPASITASVDNDVRAIDATHAVHFQEDFALGPRHRLVDRQGRIYLVLRVEKQQTHGELMQALVKQAGIVTTT
ncbi:MAG: hypothetical protein KDA42_07050 [Planctomycetales bacterium]|nr:hypothetical protein [Planctomycetales bacterium]